MLILDSIAAMKERSTRLRVEGNRLGFVPTMGSLHEGHLSLMRRARAQNHEVVASIFVNPAQFGPGEDFAAYPRDLVRDGELCRAVGVDVLFTPRADEMYPPGFATTVKVRGLTEGLCGLSRPGHFDGVTTVVAKLFSIVRPHAAYFGLKDYQQFKVVERMASDLDLPVRVVGVPTVREADGLAMSSRNAYLAPAERLSALALSRALRAAEEAAGKGEKGAAALLDLARRVIGQAPGARIDYLELVDPDTLEKAAAVGPRGAVMAMAVFVGKTRLIDNALLR
jgi:pantoate--beta-alanine ligase